jgi:signal transduction histidine kinase
MANSWQLCTQAKIVLVVSLLQLIFYQFFTATLSIPLNDKLILFFLILITLGISTFYLTYATNCIVTGSCNAFAWIIAAVVIFSVVFAMLSTVMSVMLKRSVWGGKLPPEILELQKAVHPSEVIDQQQQQQQQQQQHQQQQQQQQQQRQRSEREREPTA